MTSFFNFREECINKYDEEIYEKFIESFDALPLSCILNNKFIALHAGISPEMITLNDLKSINRFVEPPKSGLLCDVLWADPVENDTGLLEKDFIPNETRGCSYIFGLKAADTFLRKNKLLSVIRGHESQIDGYKMHRWRGLKEFPTVITIFSAANYCDSYNNKGAVIKFENNALNIQQYSNAPHPYCLPDFMNAIGWSIPFLCEKVTEMLVHILNVKSDTANEGPILPSEENVMKIKVQFLAKMMKMYKTLREENELILKLKGLCNTKKLPRGLLLEGKNAIIDAIEEYGKAKSIDKASEKRPVFVMPPKKQ